MSILTEEQSRTQNNTPTPVFTFLCTGAWDRTEYLSGGGQRLFYNPQPPCAPMLRYLHHVIAIYSDTFRRRDRRV